jgi:hypothetical protein
MAGQVACIGKKRNAYGFWWENQEEEITRKAWEDNIRMVLR